MLHNIVILTLNVLQPRAYMSTSNTLLHVHCSLLHRLTLTIFTMLCVCDLFCLYSSFWYIYNGHKAIFDLFILDLNHFTILKKYVSSPFPLHSVNRWLSEALSPVCSTTAKYVLLSLHPEPRAPLLRPSTVLFNVFY